ncbi:MAG: hypothetical protein JXB04_11450, partial [Kiritimatiellae bacterium]|nr:hypothetical protein [Kiritimatiellia bacterium]
RYRTAKMRKLGLGDELVSICDAAERRLQARLGRPVTFSERIRLWEAVMLQSMRKADCIAFDLTHIPFSSGAASDGYYAMSELWQIVCHPQLWKKTTFWKDGAVFWSGSAKETWDEVFDMLDDAPDFFW